MKTLQYIAVKTDTPENAKASVEYTLLEDNYSWSDWFSMDTEGWEDADGKPCAIVSRSEDPARYAYIIQEALENRKNAYEERKAIALQSEFTTIAELLDQDIHEPKWSKNVYAIYKCLDQILGEWDMDSYFYDISNYTTYPDQAINDPEDEFDKWYLVPVAFHY